MKAKRRQMEEAWQAGHDRGQALGYAKGFRSGLLLSAVAAGIMMAFTLASWFFL